MVLGVERKGDENAVTPQLNAGRKMYWRLHS
jgi:hypothetical protein